MLGVGFREDLDVGTTIKTSTSEEFDFDNVVVVVCALPAGVDAVSEEELVVREGEVEILGEDNRIYREPHEERD